MDYTYDQNGLRVSKTVDGVKHTYLYASGKLLRETYGSNTLDFFYDNTGYPYAVKYNGTLYYYVTNLQGDVLHLTNTSGTTVVSYSYDPYGKLLNTSGSLATTLGAANPLRYRGYYYDTETGFYYLQSRYYDPAICRFINADAFASTGQGIIGNNMFVYCLNSPVVLRDSCGTEPTEAVDVDGDGEIDYYRYDYTYTYTVYLDHHDYSFESTISGSVYIFPDVGFPPSLDKSNMPEGFDPSYDLLVGYYLGEHDGKGNPTMYAYQAHKTMAFALEPIIDIISQYDKDFNTPIDRTKPSLYIEWISHRDFWWYEGAQNVDFDNYEEGKGRTYFYCKAISKGVNAIWNWLTKQ